MPRMQLAALPLVAIFATAAMAAESGGNDGVRSGKAAFGDWQGDKPGIRRLLRPDDMPPASINAPVSSRPEIAKMPNGARPVVPPGFTVELVVAGLASPSALRVA